MPNRWRTAQSEMHCKQSIYHYPADITDPLSSKHYMKICPNKRVTLKWQGQGRKLVTGCYTIDGDQFPGAPFDVTDRFILWQCLFAQSVWMSRFREARRPAKSPKHFLLALALFIMQEKTRIHHCTTIQNNDAIKLQILYHGASGNELEKQAYNVSFA